MEDNEKDYQNIYCPLCREKVTEATLDDLSNGLRLRCSNCGLSIWVEDGYK
ncbi:hypothetical protein [Anoxybacillus sp. CHMUD]|uniref:hypothetical protein n=1 Tax=Anoxybacillus sp. CHMUD TaxID=2508870 RepID=UPI0014919382|nr:hypothetical protein [Anoxybacillus sp. CHMUD]